MRDTGRGALSALALLSGLIGGAALAGCTPKGGGSESAQPDATLGAPQHGQGAPAPGTVAPSSDSPSGSASGATTHGPATDGGDEPAPSALSAGNDLADHDDLMTFAHGVIPLSVGGAGAKLGAHVEEAIESIDGNPGSFSLVNKGRRDTSTEFVYLLPANTTFEGFAVPNVLETPSKYQTFTRVVEVYGSAVSADSGFELLASATLTTHPKKDQQTELKLVKTKPVKWVKLKLSGGVLVESEQSTFEFSELIARGKQETPALATGFSGRWGRRSAGFELKQSGAAVGGCYDGVAPLSGTVSGNILMARGVEPRTKVVSLFVLTVMPDGSIRGVRSTNGAPFKLVDFGTLTSGQAPCPSIAPVNVGCGATLHGIHFDYNSATIRADSGVLLGQVFESLKADKASKVVIEGHTSSEGAGDYNLDLSKRRAEAVVADLVQRGLAKSRISAVGRGETTPIASNADETGRSLNRRVEVKCN